MDSPRLFEAPAMTATAMVKLNYHQRDFFKCAWKAIDAKEELLITVNGWASKGIYFVIKNLRKPSFIRALGVLVLSFLCMRIWGIHVHAKLSGLQENSSWITKNTLEITYTRPPAGVEVRLFG
ncbi:hypothetical protein [Chitinimonas lacunae]|uniref:Uncharacterized protein n=1 Tax=Chitinimonas lacunae TaxID=1963018 RepID=A0ABV8MTV8_9NEIS